MEPIRATLRSIHGEIGPGEEYDAQHNSCYHTDTNPRRRAAKLGSQQELGLWTIGGPWAGLGRDRRAGPDG